MLDRFGVHAVKEFLLQARGDRAAFAFADEAAVDFADRRDFRCVPVKKASSAMYRSSRVMRRDETS